MIALTDPKIRTLPHLVIALAPKWRHTAQMDTEHRSNLRLSPEAYKAIDLLRKRMPGNVSRNTWIAMAVQEKIDRDALITKIGADIADEFSDLTKGTRDA